MVGRNKEDMLDATEQKEPEVKETKATSKSVKKSVTAKSKLAKVDGSMDTVLTDEVKNTITNRTMKPGEFLEVDTFVSKTIGNTDQNGCKKNVKDVVMFGGDLFKLLSKASSESKGWMKSTKAMDTGVGCVVQVTTQQLNKDGTYSVAEAVTFVPGVKIREERNLSGEVIARSLMGKR